MILRAANIWKILVFFKNPILTKSKASVVAVIRFRMVQHSHKKKSIELIFAIKTTVFHNEQNISHKNYSNITLQTSLASEKKSTAIKCNWLWIFLEYNIQNHHEKFFEFIVPVSRECWILFPTFSLWKQTSANNHLWCSTIKSPKSFDFNMLFI